MNRRLPLIALALSGLLWGSSAPLTKVALEALGPGWLTAVRFVLAALPLLWVARRALRPAFTPSVVASGALGYGAVIALWNEGLTRTSVSHAALLSAAVPAMVATVALLAGRGSAGGRTWLGYGLALVGVGLIAADGGGTSMLGDGLVLLCMLLSSVFTVYQPDRLAGRDPVAVTAVQFVGAALVTLPVALVTAPQPAGGGAGAWAAVAALVVAGTVLPFTLFAWAQARTTPEVAGAFLNLEPVVGVAAGAVLFGDPFGAAQLAGGAAVLGGIALSTLPASRATRPVRRRAAIRARVGAQVRRDVPQLAYDTAEPALRG